MTTHRNSRASRAARARAAAPQLAGESRVVLMGRLRRMADEVELLQTEIAAVEAYVTEPEPDVSTRHSARPGANWTPTPTPQPWLDARSA